MTRLSVAVVVVALILCATRTSAQIFSSSVDIPSVCYVNNCMVCSSSPVICSVCNNGYKLSANGLCVLNCRVVNCVVCYASDNTKCATCAGNYKRNSRYLCVLPRTTIIIRSAVSAAPASLIMAAGVSLLAAAVALA